MSQFLANFFRMTVRKYSPTYIPEVRLLNASPAAIAAEAAANVLRSAAVAAVRAATTKGLRSAAAAEKRGLRSAAAA